MAKNNSKSSTKESRLSLLTDEGKLTLTNKQVGHIFETLDRPPPESVAAIRKLLTERSILDAQ